MLMLFLEQARRQPTWSLWATWCSRAPHVGDPCLRTYKRLQTLTLSPAAWGSFQRCKTHFDKIGQ